MVLINIYVNIPLYLLSQFDVSSRNYENGLKCSLSGEHVLRENGGPWPCHGCTLPWPWGNGRAKRCSGKRVMGSMTCRFPTVEHKQSIGARKAVHMQRKVVQGSAPVAYKRIQAAQGSAQAAYR